MTGQSVGWSGNDPRERRAAGLISGDALGDGLELDPNGSGRVRLKIDPQSDLAISPQKRELTRKAKKGDALSLDGVELLIHKDRPGGYAGLDASSQVVGPELGGASYAGAGTKVLLDTTPPSFGVIPAGALMAHAPTHQHGGADEVATATPGADDIPKALGTGKLAAGWVSEVLALPDLTDVTAVTGTGTTAVLSGAPVFSGAPTVPDFTNAQHDHSSAAEGGLLTGIPPGLHATTHQHGGTDEVATATPAANAIPKANGSGKLAAGWTSETLALADLTDVAATTGTGTTAVLNGSPVLLTPTVADFTNAQHNHSSAATGGVLPAAAPAAHAASHQHGGSDEVATATPGANVIVKANASSKIAAGFLAETIALADLTDVAGVQGTGTTVVLSDFPEIDTPTLLTPIIADYTNATHDHSSAAEGGVLAASPPAAHAASHQHGGSDEVATATPAANAIPKANGSGKLAAGWTSETLALADLSNVSATTGSGSTVPFATSPTLTTPVIGDFTTAQHNHSSAATGGTLAAAAPAAHAASHQHLGSDEVAVSIPAANAIPKADGSNKLSAGWISEVLALAGLSDVTAKTGTGTTVVMDTSPAIVTPTIASFVNANHNHSSAATGGTLPAAAPAAHAASHQHGGSDQIATATPTANAIPKADGSNKLAVGWLSEVLAITELSDVAAKSGTGTDVVMRVEPTLSNPRIDGSLYDAAATLMLTFAPDASGINYLTVFNGATGVAPGMAATGGDVDVDLELTPSGAGKLTVNGVPLGDMAFVDNPIQTGRVIQLIKEQGTTNLISIGIGAPTETLPGISADGDFFAIKRYLTAATTNSTAGLITPVLFRIGYSADTLFVVTSGSVITSYRQWVGLTNTTLGLVATPTTQHVAAISYDSARDGTVFWRTVTCNGTSATITATSVAIAASTFYTVRIVTTPTTVAFYINGTLTNTHTTTLPGNATDLTMQACVTTLTTATRRFEFSRFGALIP